MFKYKVKRHYVSKFDLDKIHWKHYYLYSARLNIVQLQTIPVW